MADSPEKVTGRRPKRKTKYFLMEESQISGWVVTKKRNGYYLYGVPEIGQVGVAQNSIFDELDEGTRDGCMFGGGSETVTIDTNISLEELFEIINSYALEELVHDTSSFIINGVEIDKEPLAKVAAWYSQVREKQDAGE